MRLIKGKGRGRHQKIRSELIANREDQPRYTDRIDEQSFGVYRTVRPESVKKIMGVMNVARPKIHEHMLKERPNGQFANITLPENWQVTFVQEQKVRTAMRRGSLANTLEAGMELKEIEYRKDKKESELEVPIKRFEWNGGRRRKFAGLIAEGDALDELFSQAAVIDQLFMDVSGEGIFVEDPDHITIGTYGSRTDGLQMSAAQRKEVNYIITREFAAQEVGHILLGGIHTGKDPKGEGVNA